jgi:hypothetical protein
MSLSHTWEATWSYCFLNSQCAPPDRSIEACCFMVATKILLLHSTHADQTWWLQPTCSLNLINVWICQSAHMLINKCRLTYSNIYHVQAVRRHTGHGHNRKSVTHHLFNVTCCLLSPSSWDIWNNTISVKYLAKAHKMILKHTADNIMTIKWIRWQAQGGKLIYNLTI